MNKIKLSQVPWPEIGFAEIRPDIPGASYENRLARLRAEMVVQNLDCVAIYADREHYANFKHYIGFEPRFEEGLLIIYRNPVKESAVLLGNECLHMPEYARIPVKTVYCQYLSLPGQPMDCFISIEHCLQEAGIVAGMRVGLVGWKLITEKHCADPAHSFCVPSFLVEALRGMVGFENLVNATGMLIHPSNGLRLIHDVHQIAYLEYGAALASEGVMDAWKNLKPGKREAEMAAHLKNYGQQLSCHIMFSSGINTHKGLISPQFRPIEVGDPVSMSLGLEGGLTCRGAYIAHNADELPEGQRDFVEEVALPYYTAVVTWYETIGLGITGGELYDAVQSIIPKERFGWVLNPGHLISYEEWLSSGIIPNGTSTFQSGMLVQMDIIPGYPPYVAPNAEDGVCIADEALRTEIRNQYPDMWERFMRRRAYMENQLGIHLKEEILPMSNLAGRYSPYLLDLECAFVAK